jgi:hypothetical protein
MSDSCQYSALATLDVRDIVLRYPLWARYLSALQSVQIGCGAHPRTPAQSHNACMVCSGSVVTCSGAAAAVGRLKANVRNEICCETWVRKLSCKVVSYWKWQIGAKLDIMDCLNSA